MDFDELKKGLTDCDSFKKLNDKEKEIFLKRLDGITEEEIVETSKTAI